MIGKMSLGRVQFVGQGMSNLLDSECEMQLPFLTFAFAKKHAGTKVFFYDSNLI